MELDETLNYALPQYADEKKVTKNENDNPFIITKSEIEKKQILDWHLFKNGLLLPQMEGVSAQQCVIEGLRLISDSLVRRQDERLKSLQVHNVPSDQTKDTTSKLLLQKRTSSFLR